MAVYVRLFGEQILTSLGCSPRGRSTGTRFVGGGRRADSGVPGVGSGPLLKIGFKSFVSVSIFFLFRMGGIEFSKLTYFV
jgi:hypothetical protein